MTFPADHISYQLLIRVEEPLTLRIGALGNCTLPAGNFVYTGSARRNLNARIARHRSREKSLRWHIDYLLVHPRVRILEVRTSARDECEWNQSLAGIAPVPGFGSSDCRRGCAAHLTLLDDGRVIGKRGCP